MSTRARELGRSAASNAWWTVPQLVAAAVLGFAFGLWGLWFGYVVFNSAGVWLYCDQLGDGQRRRKLWLKGLAISQLPIGLFALFATTNHPTPSEISSSASSDGSVRKATAASPNVYSSPP